MLRIIHLKGDGNDGEPDARQKLEFEKKAKNWLELNKPKMAYSRDLLKMAGQQCGITD